LGLRVVFSGSSPTCVVLPVDDAPVTIGRVADPTGMLLPDACLSRHHAEVARTPDGWRVRDLGSRNGTFVDGARVAGETTVAAPRVIRAGDTVLVVCDDVDDAPARLRGDDGVVMGAKLAEALSVIGHVSTVSSSLLVRGESGTGKELAARRFHTGGPHAAGPFIAVNCAAIPEGLAERLLFGAKRGAYSGAAADASGYVEAADRGVLFLDEGAELDLLVQAKLLRVLETREVVPLGASQGRSVDLRVVVATHHDLREAVGAGRFREDLYHRIAPPEVVLPPLRERLDEVASHIASEVASVSNQLRPHAKLVEACMLRPWPGNVRELRKHARFAALQATAERSDTVRLEHLAPHAGEPFEGDPEETHERMGGDRRPPREYVRWSRALEREQVERALRDNAGNVALAARALGMQRTQLYREMDRWGIPRPASRAGRPRGGH
jgi:transcriptional regulator with PAS, ATPase and Fis domain